MILELAVRGKLVPQDPNDEPAGELLKKIEVEKARLIKEGKIKKQKSLPAITEEENRFDLPMGWRFTRLGELFLTISSGGTPSKRHAEYWAGDIPWASVKDLGTQRYIENTQDYITQKGLENGSRLANINDILICTRMGLGKISIVKSPMAYNQDLKAAKLTKNVNVEFFINTYSTIKIKGTGTTVKGIKQEQLLEYVIGLPPFKEQHRIVTKVDELMALCDQLETQTENSIQAHQLLVETLLATLTNAKDADELNENWQTISQHFDVLFTTQVSIDQLKQTILQLAVMGKLVKQNSKDEPACKLLERIATEKQQLIKDGKIKKQKPLPPISDEEKPFELPEGWEWAYLNSLLPQFQNGASSRGDKGGKDVIVLRLADIKNWKISLNDTRTLEIAEETIKRYSLKKGDVLIIRVNGSADIVGRFITCESDLDAIYCDHFIRMNFPIECLFTPYLFLLGSSDLIRSRIANLFVSTAGQKTVNQTHIGTLPISLPPFAEQERIVEKVDELMALCDSLKERLNQAQTTQLQLTDAIVEQAL